MDVPGHIQPINNILEKHIMDKIFTGLDRAKELGFSTYRDYLTALGVKYNHRWNGISNNTQVTARIDFGRWIADCKCGAAQYVEPDQPFYCAECGMTWNDNLGCEVIFPPIDKIIEVEAELMERPVLKRGKKDQKTIQPPPAEPGLSRSWTPDETVEELKEQRKKRGRR